jgi:hypothetical protein
MAEVTEKNGQTGPVLGHGRAYAQPTDKQFIGGFGNPSQQQSLRTKSKQSEIIRSGLQSQAECCYEHKRLSLAALTTLDHKNCWEKTSGQALRRAQTRDLRTCIPAEHTNHIHPSLLRPPAGSTCCKNCMHASQGGSMGVRWGSNH